MGFVTAEVKSRILLALQDPGHVVSSLAKMYGVSTWTIYQLRKTLIQPQGSSVKNQGSFVEVRVEEGGCPQPIASPSGFMVMEKVTFIGEGLSLTLEGKVQSQHIRRLLPFLENR